MKDIITSLIRTATPMLAGLIVTVAAKVGYNVSDQATAVAVFVLGLAYYLIARIVEQRYPKFGWVLGSPAKPTYGSK